jgi:hypothetical protein
MFRFNYGTILKDMPSVLWFIAASNKEIGAGYSELKDL